VLTSRSIPRPVYEAAPEAEVPRAHLTLAAALSQAQAPPRPQQPLAGGSGRSASDDAEVRFWQEKIAALSGPVAPADDPAAEEPGEDDEVKFWRQKIAALSRPIPGETGYDGGLEWSTQPGPLPAGSAMAFARQSMSASSSSSAGVASRPTAPVQGTHHEMPPRSGSQGVLSWTPSRPDLKSSRSSGSLLSSDVFLSNGLTGYGR